MTRVRVDNIHKGVLLWWDKEAEDLNVDVFEYMAERLKAIRAMTYAEYLRTDEWHECIRGVTLNVAKRRCQVCNSPERLNVHHRQYPPRCTEQFPRDLTVLCKTCHSLFHEHGKLVRP